jgi:hypothetical protein
MQAGDRCPIDIENSGSGLLGGGLGYGRLHTRAKVVKFAGVQLRWAL